MCADATAASMASRVNINSGSGSASGANHLASMISELSCTSPSISQARKAMFMASGSSCLVTCNTRPKRAESPVSSCNSRSAPRRGDSPLSSQPPGKPQGAYGWKTCLSIKTRPSSLRATTAIPTRWRGTTVRIPKSIRRCTRGHCTTRDTRFFQFVGISKPDSGSLPMVRFLSTSF